MMDVFLSIVTCVKLVGTNLQLIVWGDGSQVPTSGNDLVIVGIDNIRLLHIRIFDSGGNLITDTDETKLPATQAGAISTLKGQVQQGFSSPLTIPEMNQVLSEVTSITGQQTTPVTEVIVAQTKEAAFLTRNEANQYAQNHPPQTWSTTAADGTPLACERDIVEENTNVWLSMIECFNANTQALVSETLETLFTTKQDADEYVRVHPPQTWRATGSGGVPLACTRVIVAK